MSYWIEVRDLASKEFIDAYLWYEDQRNGLGEEFHDEVQEQFAFFRERPERFAKWRGPYRKINLKRFPYIIVFQVLKDVVVVYSVFHSSRNPSRWGRRR